MSVCDDGWSGGSNSVTVNASGQTLSGKILVGDDSTLKLNLSDSSTFSGNISGKISNASGSSVSTSVGTVNVTLDSTSKWYLTGDTEIASFSGTAANVITNGYSITVNGKELSGTTDSDDSDTVGVTVTGGVVTVDKTYTGKKINLSDYSSTVTKVNASKTTKGLQIIGNKYANSLVGGSGNDSLVGNSGKDTLIGGKGSDSLLGGNGNDYLNGGAGNDTFHGGYDNDTLIGGTGADYLSGGYGNDSILGGDGKDTLLGGSGNDYLNGGTGNDSIIGNAGKDTLLGGNGNDYLSGGADNDLILGGAGNDTIYGATGADTLNGGAGNDTLNGGDGKDVFVYAKSSGNDIITDYKAGTDKIKISSGSIESYEVSGKNIIFTIGNGTLTVKNGKGKKITIEDASGNVTTKKYSASSSSAKLFTEENNFVTSDNLSEITKNNLTPTALEKISETNFENLTTENNFVTYSEK